MPRSGSAADALLADLNEPQRQAVTHRDGPLLVVAGPGSGKTRVITRRAAYLVHTGVSPRSILAITFTNKATEEMQKRIEALGVSRGMWVYTFHALGVRLLREFGGLAGVLPGFSIYDEADALRVMKDALEVTGASISATRPEKVRADVSRLKNQLLTPEACAAQAEHAEEEALARVYAAYQDLLSQRNALDFDDLLMRVALLLTEHPDVAARLNERFRYVLIDEYQDTNHAQYVIAHKLTEQHRNICATGDPDQSIYGWRGADIRNILEFEQDFPEATVVRLEQNYRSHGHILRVASHLIRANYARKPKELWTERGNGEPVRVWTFADGDEEARQIAATIAADRAQGRAYSDFAIFYRVNAVSRGLEEALRNYGIPYQIVRGVEFYNRKEIRDVLAYLRVLVNPADDVALLRIINTPPRRLGDTTIARLQVYANETLQPLREALRTADEAPGVGAVTAAHVRAFVGLLDELRGVLDEPAPDAVDRVLRETGLEQMYRKEHEAGGEDRLANVQELVTSARKFLQEAEDPSVAAFLNHISLVSDQDAIDESAGAVLLMTLHAAKGLEFPVVFVVGLEQGLLPHERALESRDRDIEEERRLCFVGITRARETLYLTHAAERFIRGRLTPRGVSQFLLELGEHSVEPRDFRRPLRSALARPGLDNFVPLVDDLPPEEAARLVARRRLRRQAEEGELASDDMEAHREEPRPDATPPEPVPTERYADWVPGMLVRHATYGVGELLWVRPSGDKTRAGVKFVGQGEKTFVLDKAPIEPLQRKRR